MTYKLAIKSLREMGSQVLSKRSVLLDIADVVEKNREELIKALQSLHDDVALYIDCQTTGPNASCETYEQHPLYEDLMRAKEAILKARRNEL